MLLKATATQVMFSFYGVFTILGWVYYLMFLKDTSYKHIEVVNEDGTISIHKKQLTDLEK